MKVHGVSKLNITRHNKCDERGFTLVELMVTLFLSTIITIILYYAYQNQQKIYKSQESVVDMQQNARAALFLISEEMRMAGYDPLGIANASIVDTDDNPTSIRFTQDLNEDGDDDDANEDITIFLDNTDDLGDTPGDNCTLANPCIRRDFDGPGGNAAQPFMNNIDFFELVYTLDSGLITRDPADSALNEIKTIQINILIRSSIQEPDLDTTLIDFDVPPTQLFESRFNPDAAVLLPGIKAGTIIDLPGDSFRRRLVSATIQCRNASL